MSQFCNAQAVKNTQFFTMGNGLKNAQNTTLKRCCSNETFTLTRACPSCPAFLLHPPPPPPQSAYTATLPANRQWHRIAIAFALVRSEAELRRWNMPPRRRDAHIGHCVLLPTAKQLRAFCRVAWPCHPASATAFITHCIMTETSNNLAAPGVRSPFSRQLLARILHKLTPRSILIAVTLLLLYKFHPRFLWLWRRVSSRVFSRRFLPRADAPS